MKEILADLGHLVAVKKLNPDHLTEGIGTNRQNLIAALKGRRHLPVAHLPSLRQVLGLDDNYLFAPDRVHGLTVNRHSRTSEYFTRLHLMAYTPHGIGKGISDGM